MKTKLSTVAERVCTYAEVKMSRGLGRLRLGSPPPSYPLPAVKQTRTMAILRAFVPIDYQESGSQDILRRQQTLLSENQLP